VVNIIDKHAIIKLNELGKSTREISRELKIHRSTVTRYLKRHFKLQEKLKKATDRIEILNLQSVQLRFLFPVLVCMGEEIVFHNQFLSSH